MDCEEKVALPGRMRRWSACYSMSLCFDTGDGV
jgi:hypothetical protein